MVRKKLTLEEQLTRFKNINIYNKVISEQEMPSDDTAPAPEPTDPTLDEPVPGGEEETSMDAPTDDTGMGEDPTLGADDVPAEDPMMGGDTEEIDITDLVNLTKSIKNDLDDQKKNVDPNKDDMIISRLDNFMSTLSKLDYIVSKIEGLDTKLDTLKEPTPVEKLEMRSLDSYPFKSKPSDFFNEKQREMEMSGKNEYVLTKDDVRNYTPNQIIKTFNPDTERNNEIY